MNGSRRIWETHIDYRATTARGISTVAVFLLLPFIVFALVNQLYVYFLGGIYLLALFLATSYLISESRDHEPITLYALVPGSILLMAFALSVDGISASIGCFPLVVACYCMLSRRKADIASVMIVSVTAPVMWLALKPVEALVLSASLAVVVLFASMLLRQIESQQDILKYQIDRDPMTELLNRSSLNHRLAESVDAFQSATVPAALLSVDLDHFKRVNDLYGHDTGDLVLCEVARLLQEGVCEECPVFRLGGEEFLIILMNKDASDALMHAESLRLTISEADILQDYPISVSIGVASLCGADTADTWRRRSDNFLYVAKLNGRNRVVCERDICVVKNNLLKSDVEVGVPLNKVEQTGVLDDALSPDYS